MPFEEKLRLLEAVWAELSLEPDRIEVPPWHKDILDERDQASQEGDRAHHSMRIEILASARDDLIDGFHYYEQKEGGLGNYFLASLYSDIESLRIFGGIHAKAYRGYHVPHRSVSRLRFITP